MEFILLIIALQFITFFILYLLLKRNIEKNYGADTQIKKITQEVARIIIELNQITDRNIGLIEAKINELKEIMANTDKRILLMKRDEEKHDMSKKLYNSIIEKSNRDFKMQDNNIKKEVLKLYQSGFNSNMIANQLGAPLGEVELIISLAENE